MHYRTFGVTTSFLLVALVWREYMKHTLRGKMDRVTDSNEEILDEMKKLRRDLRGITILEKLMGTSFDKLVAEVEANTTLDGSVAALLDGIDEKLEEAKVAREKMDQLAEDLRASREKLQAAVKKHTEADEGTDEPLDPSAN